jgi:excisionase family DNA binding protein
VQKACGDVRAVRFVRGDSMTTLLTVEQVAALLGMSEGWVYQHSCGARRPTLPSVKLGRAVRFRLESVQEFVSQMERGICQH